MAQSNPRAFNHGEPYSSAPLIRYKGCSLSEYEDAVVAIQRRFEDLSAGRSLPMPQNATTELEWRVLTHERQTAFERYCERARGV